MARVPYNPAPTVSAQQSPTPYQNIPVDADMFGAAVGRAESQLGSALGNFGDVMANNAIKMQERTNEADANNQFANATIELGQLEANQAQLQGKARMDAFPDFQQKANAIWQKYRSSMNPDTQKRFDSLFHNRVAVGIAHEAMGAAGALKTYENQSATNALTISQQDAGRAANETALEASIQNTNKIIDGQAQSNGWAPEKLEVERRKAIDTSLMNFIETKAMSDPMEAQRLLNKYKDQFSDEKNFNAVKNRVDQGMLRAGTRIDADDIWGKTGAQPGYTGKKAEVSPNGTASENANFFSSGRARQEGLNFNPDTDIVPVSSGGKTVAVNKYAAADVKGFLDDLQATGYKINEIGGYNARKNVNDPSRLSEHAFGNAIDINESTNPNRSTRTDLPANIADIAAKHHMIWGGNWRHPDPMHFEWVGPGGGKVQIAATGNSDIGPSDVPKPIKYNNPGAQYPNEFTSYFGSTGTKVIGGGNLIATFDDPTNGAAANMATLGAKYVGLTIGDAQKRWSGGARGDIAGFDSNTVITPDMVKDPNFMVPFMKAMADAEAPNGSKHLTDEQWNQAFVKYAQSGAADKVPLGNGPDRLAKALQMVDQYAQQRYPNDPGMQAMYADELRSRLNTKYSTDRRVLQEQRRDRYFTVMQELIKPPGEAAPTQLEQLSPQAQTAYADMDPVQQRAVKNQFEANAKRGSLAIEDQQKEYQRLIGLSYSQNPDDRDQFMETAPGGTGLSVALQNKIFSRQTAMRKEVQSDARIDRAIREVQPILNDSGYQIFSSKTNSDANNKYNQFVGAYVEQLQEYAQEHNGQLPDRAARSKMASDLIAIDANSTWGFGMFGGRMNFEPPDDFVKRATPLLTQQLGRAPTARELSSFYQWTQKHGQH